MLFDDKKGYHKMNRDINKIFLVSLNESFDSKLYNALSSLISSDKKAKLDSYTSFIDKKLGLYSDLLIRFAIHQDLNIENCDISFGTNFYGKPFLNNNQSFYFNISHTHNMIAVAISNNPVGIDIENLKNANIGIAKRYFNADEIEYINVYSQDANKRFIEIWTKKEAYLKFLGVGLNKSLKSFNVFDNEIFNHFYTITYGSYVVSTYLSESNLTPPVIVISEIALLELVKEL